MTSEIGLSLTSDYLNPAQRPLFSALECSKFEQTFALNLPDWEAALELALDSFDGSLKIVK